MWLFCSFQANQLGVVEVLQEKPDHLQEERDSWERLEPNMMKPSH